MFLFANNFNCNNLHQENKIFGYVLIKRFFINSNIDMTKNLKLDYFKVEINEYNMMKYYLKVKK